MSTNLEITTTNLVDSIQYASGAIVSKTLLKRATGTITLFAFDQGQELSEHVTPFEALVQMLDGSAVWHIGSQPINAHAGDYLILPANIPHAVIATTAFKMLLTMIRTEK